MTRPNFKKLLYKQPLSLRGLLALILSYIALSKYAIPENDFIAFILGGSGLLLIIFLLPLLILNRYVLAKKIRIQTHIDSKNLFSRQKIESGLSLSSASISPSLELKIKKCFKQKGVQSSTHILKGKTLKKAKRSLVDTTYFPHRGLWDLSEIEISIADVFGLTRLSWNYSLQQQYEISAKEISIETLPVVVSAAQAGDKINDHQIRAGDLYDIKAYDPSDGTKHILWKTYAKSGQLVVRRPEQAVIPEGEVAIYLIAKKDDDDLAAALLDYIKQLERQNIETLFSTDGLSGEIIEKATAINTAINEVVWSPAAGRASDLQAFIEQLLEIKHNIRDVVVFSRTEKQILNKLERAANNHQINISVAYLENNLQTVNQTSPLISFIKINRC